MPVPRKSWAIIANAPIVSAMEVAAATPVSVRNTRLSTMFSASTPRLMSSGTSVFFIA